MAIKVITNLKILKAMAKQKLIVLHEDTGKTLSWQGRKIRANYIKDGKVRFKFKNKEFVTRYLSGSFYPYVAMENN